MELIVGIMGMIICWRGRAYKEIRLFFISFAMQTFYVGYLMIVATFILPRYSPLDHEIYQKIILVVYTTIPLTIYAVIYGTLLAGIYKTIKRFQGNSREERTEEI